MRLDENIRTFPKIARIAIFWAGGSGDYGNGFSFNNQAASQQATPQLGETRILLLELCKFRPPLLDNNFHVECFTTKKECVKKPEAQIPLQSAIAIAIN